MTLQVFQPDLASQLLCDLLSWDETRSASLGSQMAGVDWPAFARLAAGQQLASVAYKRLQGLARQGQAPGMAVEALRDLYLAQAAANLRRTHWLGQVLRELNARGIPVVALKGAYLAEEVYADSALRPMSDVDLLVRTEYLVAAAQALTDLGYHPEREYFLDFELQVGHQLPPFSKEGATPIELHWRLMEPHQAYAIDTAGLWERACPTTVAGEPALGLGAEDLLLHLCMHTAKHGLRPGLRAVYDVAATVEQFSATLDWEVLARRGEAWHAERAAFLLLWLAMELFRAPVPEETLHGLRPADFEAEQVDLARRLLFTLPGEQTDVPQHLAELVQSTSTIQRLRLAWWQLFLPRQIMARAYPARPDSWKIFLYYPVRWCGLFLRFLFYIERLVRRDPQVLARSAATHNRQIDEERLFVWVSGKPPSSPSP